MQISVERDDPNKSSTIFYWLVMKYRWTHASVCLTDFSRNQLLFPKTLTTSPLSGDFQSRATQPQNRSSFTNVHFWTCKCKQNKFCRFCSLVTQIVFFWGFLKIVYLNVYSIAWTPVGGYLRLSTGSFSRTPAGNRALSENRSKEWFTGSLKHSFSVKAK